MDKLFADLRQKVVGTIHTWGQEHAIPAATVDRVIDGLLPSINLRAKKGGTSRKGGSRIGGLPDLPEGVSWPRVQPDDALDQSLPMSFVMQVNLAEVSGFDTNKVLPSEGLLSLFYYWDDDAGGDEGRILFFPAPLPALHRPKVPSDLDEDGRYRSFSLEARPEWTLPDRSSLERRRQAPDLDAWFDLRDQVVDVQGLGGGLPGLHRMLGNPDWIQQPGAGDDLLLLQADSDDSEEGPGISWGDGGRLFCTLSEADLRARKFDRVSMDLDMC